jgi:hypothetical protein
MRSCPWNMLCLEYLFIYIKDGIKELVATVPADNEILSMEHALPGIVVIGTIKV